MKRIEMLIIAAVAFAVAFLIGLTPVNDANVAEAQTKPIAFVPTGTGVFKVAASVEQSTAGAVDLASSDVTGVLSTSNGGTGTSSFPAPGTAGNLLVSNGSAWSAGSNGWVTLLDFDFSAQSNQTLSTNTTYSIGGYSWSKQNSANDRVAMAVTNGSGLIIQPSTTSNYNFGARTAPLLFLPFTQIAGTSSLNWTSGIRLWVYTTALTTANNNTDYATYGFDNNGSTLQYVVFRYAKASGNWTSQTMINVNGSAFTSALITSSAVFNASNNGTTTVETNNLVSVPQEYTFARWGTGYSSGWPTEPSLFYIGASQIVPTGTTVFSVVQATVQNTLGIVLAAQGNGASDNVSVTIARIRFDVRY